MSKVGDNAGACFENYGGTATPPCQPELGRTWRTAVASTITPVGPQRTKRFVAATIVPCVLLFFGAGVSAAELKRDETVLLFPAFASRGVDPAQWETTLHVWVGELEPRGLPLATLRSALGLATDLSADETDIFNEQARWFLADNERDKEVPVKLGEQTVNVGPTDANGHAYLATKLQATRLGNLAVTKPEALTLTLGADSSGPGQVLAGELFLVEPTGLSVISDIDDTIKITEVRDREAMLRNTFLRSFRPAPGMASLYERWRTNDHAQFHYVSASPWQLYPALAEFRRTNGFPAGTFHLKTLRLKDESFLDLFQSPVEYKLGVIEPLLAKFPQRRFILVGDSGEADPEVYGEVTRRHPEQIERILIRDVTNEDERAERYRAAFREVAPEKWSIFEEPNQIVDR